MKKLIVAITVMMFGFSAFAQNTGNLLNNYISVKNALVSSDSKAANTAISALARCARNLIGEQGQEMTAEIKQSMKSR